MAELKNQLDTGWAWVVLAAAFINICLAEISFMMVAICMLRYAEYFDASMEKTGVIPAVRSAASYSLAIPSCIVIDRLGCMTGAALGGAFLSAGMFLSYFATDIGFMYFSFGILTGIGHAFVAPASFSVIYKYFDKRKGLAAGILMCAFGLPFLGIIPLLNIGLDQVGWKGVHLIVSALCLNICAFSVLFRDAKMPRCSRNSCQSGNGDNESAERENESCLEDIGGRQILEEESEASRQPTKKQNFFMKIIHAMHLEMFKNCNFVFYVLAQVIFEGSTKIMWKLLVVKVTADGFGDTSGLFLSIMGSTNFAATLLLSFIGDNKLIHRIEVCALSILASAPTIFYFAETTSYGGNIAALTLYGVITGGVYTEKYAILVDILGPKHIALATGWLKTLNGLVVASVPLAGRLYDNYGYIPAFYLSGVLCTLGGVVGCAVALKMFILKQGQRGGSTVPVD